MSKKEWLTTETGNWVKKKIITTAQASKILSQYGDEESSKTMQVVSTIGAILIGLGMILFVASNWQGMPASIKLVLLYGTTFGLYYAGWFVTQKSYQKTGLSLLFLGSIMVGVTLALTAQIFNLEANFTRFFLIWFIAVAPLSYFFHSKPTLILSKLLFGAFLAAFIGGANADFDDIFKGFFEGFGVFLFYGLTMYGIGTLHHRTPYKDFVRTYQSTGVIFSLLIGFALIVSELEIIDEIGNHWLSYVFMLTALFTLTQSALALKTHGNKKEVGWILLALFIAMAALALGFNSNPQQFVYLIPLHLAYVGLLMLTLLVGYEKRIAAFINIGLVFFIMYLGYFYFTTIFTYIDRSLALVIGGVILLVGGWYLEKK